MVTEDKHVATASLSDYASWILFIAGRLWANEKGQNIIEKVKLLAGEATFKGTQGFIINPRLSGKTEAPVGFVWKLFTHYKSIEVITNTHPPDSVHVPGIH